MKEQKLKGTFTKFFDMASGGYEKTDYSAIYIEAEEDRAIEIFEAKFNIDPFNETCECCGSDFYIYELSNIEVGGSDLVITKDDIKKAEQSND